MSTTAEQGQKRYVVDTTRPIKRMTLMPRTAINARLATNVTRANVEAELVTDAMVSAAFSSRAVACRPN